MYYYFTNNYNTKFYLSLVKGITNLPTALPRATLTKKLKDFPLINRQIEYYQDFGQLFSGITPESTLGELTSKYFKTTDSIEFPHLRPSALPGGFSKEFSEDFFLKSPFNPMAEVQEEKRALVKGTAFHALMETGSFPEEEIAVFNQKKISWSTISGKKQKEEFELFQATNSGKIVLWEEEAEKVRKAALLAKKYSAVSPYLSHTQEKEVTIKLKNYLNTGYSTGGTLDLWFKKDSEIGLIDFKTTSTDSGVYQWKSNSEASQAKHLQLAAYGTALAQKLGIDRKLIRLGVFVINLENPSNNCLVWIPETQIESLYENFDNGFLWYIKEIDQKLSIPVSEVDLSTSIVSPYRIVPSDKTEALVSLEQIDATLSQVIKLDSKDKFSYRINRVQYPIYTINLFNKLLAYLKYRTIFFTVREGDDFSIKYTEQGLHVTHLPKASDENLTLCLVGVLLDSSGAQVGYTTFGSEKMRKLQLAFPNISKNPLWSSFFDEMAKKTMIKELLNNTVFGEVLSGILKAESKILN
jgi:PD-(D/E)XK nuclease superfamily